MSKSEASGFPLYTGACATVNSALQPTLALCGMFFPLQECLLSFYQYFWGDWGEEVARGCTAYIKITTQGWTDIRKQGNNVQISGQHIWDSLWLTAGLSPCCWVVKGLAWAVTQPGPMLLSSPCVNLYDLCKWAWDLFRQCTNTLIYGIMDWMFVSHPLNSYVEVLLPIWQQGSLEGWYLGLEEIMKLEFPWGEQYPYKKRERHQFSP